MTIPTRLVLDALFNKAITVQSPAAATETVVAGSQIALNGPLKVGDTFSWRVIMSKTGAGTGTTAFLVKSNTSPVIATGTTNGAATLATLTFGVAETAVASSAVVDVEFTVTKVDPTTGTGVAKLLVKNSATAATGFSNQDVMVASTGLVTDSTIASVGLAITAGVADVISIQYANGGQYSPS